MNKYTFTFTVETDTREHAVQAVMERLGYDEDLGFDYQFSWPELVPEPLEPA